MMIQQQKSSKKLPKHMMFYRSTEKSTYDQFGHAGVQGMGGGPNFNDMNFSDIGDIFGDILEIYLEVEGQQQEELKGVKIFNIILIYL